MREKDASRTAPLIVPQLPVSGKEDRLRQQRKRI
jgi:hypothetical protein